MNINNETLIISKPSIIWKDLLETQETILSIEEVKEKSKNIILLSNRPAFCMKNFWVQQTDKDWAEYYYWWTNKEKWNWINVLLNDSRWRRVGTYKIKYDYIIHWNWIRTFDENDNTEYTWEYLSWDTIDAMIDVFKSRWYLSASESSKWVDEFWDRFINKWDKTYKFFSPDIWSIKPELDTYGMQCSAINDEYDKETIKIIEETVPEIVWYILNWKPCFYLKENSKLNAIEDLVEKWIIDIKKSYFFLSCESEKDIMEKYPLRSFPIWVPLDNFWKYYESLDSVLKKLDI